MAIKDYSTTNKTFIDMAEKLKQQGVKNNDFMLMLHDDGLKGVDPYDPNLSVNLKARVYIEICKNFWYFIREIARLPLEGGDTTKGNKYGLNLGNLAISYACVNNLNHIAILPRQQGKTVAETMFSTWTYNFRATNTKETYVHKAQQGSVDNLKMTKTFKELLPQYIKDFIISRSDVDNQEEKFNVQRGNQMRALSAANTDDGADKLGRGSTTAMVYFDEFAFLNRNKVVYNAMLPAQKTAALNAALNKSPYGIRITTTPNTLSKDEAIYCYEKIIGQACKFTYALYDIPEEDLHLFVDQNSMNNFVHIQYSWKELGRDQSWYDNLVKEMLGDRANAKRELDLVWPESGEGILFTEEELEKILENVKEIHTTIAVNNYQIYFYEYPRIETNYIMSCDVSGGMSQDRSIITFIHPEDFRVVGLFMNSRIDIEQFTNLIAILSKNYFINAVINVENNSYGKAVLDKLSKDSQIEPKLYREYVEAKAEKTLHNGQVVQSPRKKIKYGTVTSRDSRKLMFDMLMFIVSEEPENIVSMEFYQELQALRNKHGKVEAASGRHDDIVMSYLITRYSLQYGTCFKNRFGISSVPTARNVRTISNSVENNKMFEKALNTATEFENASSNRDEGMAMSAEILDMIRKDIAQGYIDTSDEKIKKIYGNTITAAADPSASFMDQVLSMNEDIF